MYSVIIPFRHPNYNYNSAVTYTISQTSYLHITITTSRKEIEISTDDAFLYMHSEVGKTIIVIYNTGFLGKKSVILN
jgi:hypothetical protein